LICFSCSKVPETVFTSDECRARAEKNLSPVSGIKEEKKSSNEKQRITFFI
jgi:hypothetical protein